MASRLLLRALCGHALRRGFWAVRSPKTRGQDRSEKYGLTGKSQFKQCAVAIAGDPYLAAVQLHDGVHNRQT